jgi:hypothetical protein
MPIIRTVLIVIALLLVGLIFYAAFNADFLASFGQVLEDPWGVVAIVDLYAGFVAIAVLVWLLEPVRWVRLAVIVPLFFLGNPWVIAWLVWRLPLIAAKLARN